MATATKPTNGTASKEADFKERLRRLLNSEEAPSSDEGASGAEKEYTAEIERRKRSKFVDPTGNVISTTVKPIPAQGKPKEGQLRRGEVKLEWLCDIQEEQIDWLIPGRVPLKMLTLFSGDKGSGKSTLASKLAAMLSTGEAWPDDEEELRSPVSAIILNAEEHANSIVKPRLRRFGADMTKIGILQSVVLQETDKPALFDLGRDMDSLTEKLAQRGDVRLIIVDSVSAYLARCGALKGGEVRQMFLDPLKNLAETQGLAVVLINHLNKGSGTKAIYRSKDAVDIPNVCRMTWLVAPDPDDKSRRIWAPSNSNLATGPALAFRVSREGEFGWDDEVDGDVDADAILAREAFLLSKAGKRGPFAAKLKAATEWLKRRLADGPVLLGDLISEGEAQKQPISRATLNRALKRLQACSLRNDGAVFYQLPEAPDGAQVSPGGAQVSRNLGAVNSLPEPCSGAQVSEDPRACARNPENLGA